VGAFQSCGLTNASIGTGVTSIAFGAFYACGNLTRVTIPNNVTSIGPTAFEYCGSLTSITIPSSVTSIGNSVFGCCLRLGQVYFQGNAPQTGSYIFYGAFPYGVVYYLPGTTGWGTTFGGPDSYDSFPTALWFLPNPIILSNSSFGLQTNAFGFIISWATNLSIVVEACTNLSDHTWSAVSTNTLTGGSSYFSDPQWTNYPTRLYRIRSP
jgi:hypothetical protein